MKSILEICRDTAGEEAQSEMLNKAANKLRQVRREAYRVTITMAMERNGRDLEKTARELGITLACLYWNIRDLALPYPTKKAKHLWKNCKQKTEPKTQHKKPSSRVTVDELVRAVERTKPGRQVFL